jgi:transcriptional regulator with XRE-family HTH domain
VQPIWAERLKAKLRPRGKQAEIARQLQIDDSTISGYKSGRRFPDGEGLTQLCRALNISPDWLLGFTDVESPLHRNDETSATAVQSEPVRWQCPCCGATLATTRAET